MYFAKIKYNLSGSEEYVEIQRISGFHPQNENDFRKNFSYFVHNPLTKLNPKATIIALGGKFYIFNKISRLFN